MTFLSVNASQEKSIADGIINGDYSLLLGAGASHDSTNHLGRLPLASHLLAELVRVCKEPSVRTLPQAFSLLDANEIKTNITERLSGATAGETLTGLARYSWRRIFTFNIDDALHSAYGGVKHQTAHHFHFCEPLKEFQTKSDLSIIYLHGSVKEPEKGYVFSRDHYIEHMRTENPWMVVLSAALKSDPVIIAGSSMDEMDLDYYLSFRTELSSREDIAPSIYVSAEANRLTEKLCEKHQLLHFVGHSVDFVNYLKKVVPTPPPIEERIAAGIREILPGVVDRSAAMHFDSDFELVPHLPAGAASSNKFYYGMPPTWQDLASQLDIPRSAVASLEHTTSENLGGGRHVAVLFGDTGSGKTSALRRLAFNLSGRGQARVLWASELGRMSGSTASTLDSIDDEIILVVDNFADHAQSISDVLSTLQRDNIIIIGGERTYRKQYLDRVMGSGGYQSIALAPMTSVDVSRLVDKLTIRMLVGERKAISKEKNFISSLRRDPIAVATCRILNDLRPLNRIVSDLVSTADPETISAYCAVGLASHCFKGGLRYSILSSLVRSKTLASMLKRDVGLSLRYVDQRREYVTIENSTLADEILFHLTNTRFDTVLQAFVNVANGIAPYVNRGAIRGRSPEARLSGRLFDYDDVVEKFLGARAEEFYEQTKETWRWNSRYWEQISLLKLTQSERAAEHSTKKDLIEEALQHARYSVAIEGHSFGLTTLGKVLMRLQEFSPTAESSYYDEANKQLSEAIELETKRGRTSIHPYSTLISGTLTFVEQGGKLTSIQSYNMRRYIDFARRRWQNEIELVDAGERLRRLL